MQKRLYFFVKLLFFWINIRHIEFAILNFLRVVEL